MEELFFEKLSRKKLSSKELYSRLHRGTGGDVGFGRRSRNSENYD
jgi:hypothetical protein